MHKTEICTWPHPVTRWVFRNKLNSPVFEFKGFHRVQSSTPNGIDYRVTSSFLSAIFWFISTTRQTVNFTIFYIILAEFVRCKRGCYVQLTIFGITIFIVIGVPFEFIVLVIKTSKFAVLLEIKRKINR